ncbi:membrane protein insertion efficiency factor YidD [Loigolactobacillus backii]|uniref:Putative membrane protein insertion efficiency factor n=1 Tax=Loigolactobacillus backii TaxID=375175 RepID=A0A192H4A1_9LACO|nr:membrane protein insertion efficiency factor YidD [Loigolactobacillus backii]ANK59865.1 membrane protein insertion efficiency factor YidD [Loigolactobacillus backii]ANK63200.1 membrane protein insertion efficiency factor YidD [Loigolactobacillus backii]ANK64798.1 membrane protein insertion efficiency factor YidD [Loigolactobacillus backii]ANK66754.1 membrane protein insertion efficiency factor YidD [Loigolactobacillus backii]ANK69794.1 membrane protein insertion efficiency factor YidD [Loig
MKQLLVRLIRIYQRYLSPALPKSCRYYPTCSHYAIEAIEQYGVFKGSLMAISRLLRCQPFVTGGFDPVPGKFLIGRNHNQQEIEEAKVKYYGETTK